MLYRVKCRYGHGGEVDVAQFSDIANARLFINAKKEDDISKRLKTIYFLYEGMDLMETSGTETAGGRGETGGNASAGSAGQSSGFQPTPFNLSPRPQGVPHSWVKSESEEKDKK